MKLYGYVCSGSDIKLGNTEPRRVKFSDENSENNSNYVNSLLFDDDKQVRYG